ncbi:MAG: phosphatidate cytidylyltransferase [Salinivenus sp.]
MSEDTKRILTALLGAPIAIALAYTGGASFAVAVAAVGLVGQMELYRMAQVAGTEPSVGSGLVLGALTVATLGAPWFWPALALGLLAYIISTPFWVPRDRFLPSVGVTLFGAVYPTGLLGSLVLLRNEYIPGGETRAAFWLVVLTFLLVWATDVVAYYVGTWLGDRPLAPELSPNKTWEGTLGGLAAAGVVAVGGKFLLVPFLGWVDVVVIAVLGGGVSQVGDLMESQLKRSTNMDDSSGLLPGHGGVLDRFDALAVAAPLIYVYCYLVGLF